MSDRSPFDDPWTPPAGGLLDPAAAAPPAPSAFSLLGYGDPVMSLLGNVFSGGRVGADQIAGAGGGGSQLAPVQRRSATDALLAAGAALANAGGRRLGPQPTWAQALTGAMAAGSSAAEEGQTRQMLLDQSQQVLAQSARDAELRRQLMDKQIEQADLAARVIKAGAAGALGGRGPAGGVSPALQGDVSGAAMPVQPGDYPGSGVREALATRESGGAGGGYAAVNSSGYSGRYQLGAGLASDAGLYTPAQGENLKANQWAGRFTIPGHPEVQTRDDLLRSPDAQEQAYRVAMSHNDQQLAQLGVYDRALAKGTIGGVPVTREGLLAGAWLGGVGGVRDWVDSDGKTNAADSNRTRVSSYVRLGSAAAPADGTAAAPASGTAAPAGGTAAPAGGTQVAAAAPATATDTPTPILPPDQQAVAAAGLTPLSTPAAAALPAAAGRAGAGGGLPPTPVPPNAATPTGALSSITPQQWTALALLPYGKQAEGLAKMLGEPGGETKTIEDPNTHIHWMWRTDRQGNPIARIGLAPTDPKHVNVLSPDGQQLEIHTVMPGGGLGPLVGYAPHQPQITEISLNGQNVRGVYVPGQGFKPIGDAPLPPELAPKPPGRIASNIAEQAGIVGATEDEKNARKAQVDLYAGRDHAAQTRTQLDMLDALQDPQGKFKTGAVTPQLATAGAFAASLGVPLGKIAPGLSPESATNAQVFQKITNGLALSHIGPGGLPANTFSEADRNFVSAMGPQLTNTPDANRIITSYMRATNARQLEQADRWDAWRQDPAHQAVPGGPDGAASWRGFQTEWNRYANTSPVVNRLKGDSLDAIKAEVAALPPGRLWYTIDNKGRLQGGLSAGPPVAPAPPPGG